MTTEAQSPHTKPHPLRLLVRGGTTLVLVSPLIFSTSLWMQSWVLYALFGVALNLGLGLIVWAWFKTPTGDGAWPFTPADGPPPARWAPEVVFWLRWSLCGTSILLAVGALVWLLLSNGLIGSNLLLVTVMMWSGFIGMIGWPFVFPVALGNAIIQSGWDADIAAIQGFVPLKLRERRERFNENWPNVEGWG